MSLKTKNVFLTGGAQGLGKSYTDALLSLDARVVFGDVNRDTGAATEQEFKEKYGPDKVKFVECDVTDGSKFEEAFQSAVAFLGHVDLFVNNAGILNEGRWELMIDINYTALVRGTLMAVEHMRVDKGGKGGRVVNISSQYGLTAGVKTPIYCGTKHAVRSFTTNLAEGTSVKSQGIEYGILCPGPAATDLIFKLDEDKCRDHDEKQLELLKQYGMAPISRIQEGFVKLVLLEEMNGAILFVSKKEMQFVKMEKVNVGEDWPVKQKL